MFLADTGDAGSDADVIALAEKFLLTRPGTTYEPEVRMKLAEILFRKGDYQGAEGIRNTGSAISRLRACGAGVISRGKVALAFHGRRGAGRCDRAV